MAPGKLKVTFEGGKRTSDYWVLGLGPLNSLGLYDWAIVSEPKGAYLFVLARDVHEFTERYDKAIRKNLKERGFTYFYNRPIATYQGSDCIYENPLSTEEVE